MVLLKEHGVVAGHQPAHRRVPSGSPVATIVLVLASTLVGYVLLELIFFRVVITNIQFKVRPHLTELAEVLVQTSKTSFIPQNYVAVLGDSYAEGIGDWLHLVSRNEALPFHSAHIIHERIGRDVVSFGKAGAGSAEALVLLPERVMAASQCLIFPNLPPPRDILVYFYEGNDIQDNLAFLSKVNGAFGATDPAAIDAFLAQRYGTFEWWRCHAYLMDVAGRMAKYLYRYYLTPPLKPSAPNAIQAGRPLNEVIVGGRVVGLPLPLEGPGLELDDQQVNLGVQVFARSLHWLKQRFPDVPITVIYLPAPLSVYAHSGSSVTYVVQPADANRVATSLAEAIAPRHNQICNSVRYASTTLGVDFLDSTPTLRAASATRLVHGPLDWGHFNESGYRALGELVACKINGCFKAEAVQRFCAAGAGD